MFEDVADILDAFQRLVGILDFFKWLIRARYYKPLGTFQAYGATTNLLELIELLDHFKRQKGHYYKPQPSWLLYHYEDYKTPPRAHFCHV